MNDIELKYGCNPDQSRASYAWVQSDEPVFEVLNGRPGYINLLDAINAWQLVKECRQILDLPAAASFKHVSPAGAAVAIPCSDRVLECYGFLGAELSPLATAYLRARGADPSSSFGDFIGLSDKVDVATAQILAKVVSDGVIAPDYEEEALEILKKKKKGSFIVLKANAEVCLPDMEHRECLGLRLSQERPTRRIDPSCLEKIVSQNKELTQEARRDLLLGLITLRYTQSNSTGYAVDGQMIGIGAGQQSRVDCTKLAGRKADAWFLRQHEKVLGLSFRDGMTRQEKINWRLRYVEGDLTAEENKAFQDCLCKEVPEFTEAEKKEWLSQLKEVCFVSDAFLPFRDNIDHASRHGVRYIAQTGGSSRDEDVTGAADTYGMTMVHTGIRLFHH